ncbi:hypothetical protein DRQ16_03965 [bacterium]|nr:MAG: hypothetical protein DRQ16_03965 [bacterium]
MTPIQESHFVKFKSEYGLSSKLSDFGGRGNGGERILNFQKNFPPEGKFFPWFYPCKSSDSGI